ncbi:hypothetical protein [[Phormidium] sp. ETS-05]|uniref:hypothetical protein n=1 Tax=[Phormidium] sp. ETS-05 TaxID=222819 RepID=UPI0018EECF0B|nr:hypothetical protein [[Phormidium] sp. ETS-05]
MSRKHQSPAEKPVLIDTGPISHPATQSPSPYWLSAGGFILVLSSISGIQPLW